MSILRHGVEKNFKKQNDTTYKDKADKIMLIFNIAKRVSL